VVRLYLTVPALLLVVSAIPAFADGSVTVVSGKAYNVGYTSTGVQVIDAQADQSLGEIMFTIQVSQNDATLQITLPRELIDSKNTNGTDSDFLVVVDGVLTKAQEITTPTTRTLQFTHLTTDEKEIDVIGTFLASSSSVGPAIPTTPKAPQQNPTTPVTPPPPVTKTPPPTTPPPAPPVIAPVNIEQGKSFIQKTFGEIISKMPYLRTFVKSLGLIDYIIIGSIALVIVLVIASVARHKSTRIARGIK